MATKTRRELENMKVLELRDLAREATGPGTWISHARKTELIHAIITGTPPASAVDSHSKVPHGMDRSLDHVVRDMIADMVDERMRELEERVDRLETSRGKSRLEREIERLRQRQAA